MSSKENKEAQNIIDVSANRSELSIYESLVKAEADRRSIQKARSIGTDLRKLESRYFGPEVGFIRRASNLKLIENLDMGGRLLDYGCGGAWWKDEYWPQFKKVTACEVDRSALVEISNTFPDTRLWWTANGIIDTSEKFDVVLSSSVLGYILPEQARLHVQCAYELLEKNGQFILTRVLALDLIAILRAQRLVELPGPSFAYHYSRTELKSLLQATGFRDIKYVPLGIRIPGLDWRLMQSFYRFAPAIMRDALPILFPMLKIHHMFLARK